MMRLTRVDNMKNTKQVQAAPEERKLNNRRNDRLG